MDIACIGTTEKLMLNLPQKNISYYKNVHSFLNNPPTVDAIIVAITNIKKSRITLQKLRQHPTTALLPIFTSDTNKHIHLFDGHFNDLKNFENTVNDIQHQLKKLKVISKDDRSHFLAYLYSRKNLILIPSKAWQNPFYYFYPMPSLFLERQEDCNIWLEELRQDKILTEKYLVDSFFTCPYCSSAHLQFTEHCPECHSQDIEARSFLHCFTCGLIAPEKEFLKEGKLICHKCHSTLRHFGDEYDRPLESGQCHHCHQYYQDAELKSICMLCKKNFAPDRLAKRNIYALYLSEHGREILASQRFSATLKVFEHINYIQPNYFYVLVDWLIQLNKRCPEEIISLLGIHIELKNQSIDTLNKFANNLRKILRQTDVLTRLHENNLWILLPKTDKKDLHVFEEKIIKKDLFLKNQIEIRSVSFSSDSEEITADCAETLITKLGAQLL